MTLQDIKNSSGYSTIINYNVNISSLESLDNIAVYQDNGNYYKDFYISYQNQNVCLKVKMIVTETATGYNVKSGYITLSASTTDMLITNAKTMGMCPTTADNCSELLNDWYTAVNNDTALHDGLLNIYGNTETVPLWYDFADNYLHVDNDYLDLIYNYLNKYYGGTDSKTDNIYAYSTINREQGTYTLDQYGNIHSIDYALCGKTKNGDITVESLSADNLHQLLNLCINFDDPITEHVKNCQVQRIGFRHISPTLFYIKMSGFNLLNGELSVDSQGNMHGTVNLAYVIDYKYENGVLSKYDSATYTTPKSCTFSNTVRIASLDAYGMTDSGLAVEIYSNVIDSIGFSGKLKPYTVTGTTPTNRTRQQEYTNWVDTVDDPDPDPDPDPDDRRDPVPPDPVVVVDPQPPLKVDPIIEDEESNVDTYEDDPPDNNKALGNIYDLGTDGVKLGELADQLYDPTNVERICQVWKNNPNESIISLHYMYIQPDKQSGAVVKLGNFNTNINADYVTSRYKMFDCGTRAIERKFNNAMDYQTNISLYLPFSGIHQLDINEVMNSKIHVKGCVDVISGDILYSILVNRKSSKGTYLNDDKCLYTFTGNCKVDIPFSSSSLNSGMVSGIGGVLSSIVSKNPIGALTGALGTAVGGSTSVSHGGSLSGNTGAMGYKYPYLIIEYPKVIDVSLRGKLFGYKSNQTVKVNQLSGYAEFEKVHVDTVSCSDEDRQEIERILKDGIII